MDKQAIGIFDSGLGGLTVVKEIVKLLPHEDIVYLGDTARVPYGTRSVATIKKFSLEDTNFLLKEKVKCIVIACHTSSAVVGRFLKKKLKNVPVFDVVTPVLKELKRDKKSVGIIGTRATIASGAYSKIKNVTQIACPLFVPFIEEGEIKGKLIENLVKKYLRNLKVNALILACTHYPIISKAIKRVLPGVKLINPAVGVAKELKNYLIQKKLLNKNRGKGTRSYYVTDLNERFIKVAEMFLGEKLDGKIRKVNIE